MASDTCSCSKRSHLHRGPSTDGKNYCRAIEGTQRTRRNVPNVPIHLNQIDLSSTYDSFTAKTSLLYCKPQSSPCDRRRFSIFNIRRVRRSRMRILSVVGHWWNPEELLSGPMDWLSFLQSKRWQQKDTAITVLGLGVTRGFAHCATSDAAFRRSGARAV